MGTTTIRLEVDLQARIAATAERGGKTVRASIVDAIARTSERSESDDGLQRVDEERWDEQRESGKSVAFDEALAYLEARAQGLRPSRPSSRKVAD